MAAANAAALRQTLTAAGYIADDDLAAAIFLARELSRPLLLEGEAGAGKTAVADALAQATDAGLIRLQCYEGLDAQNTLYEWNYQKQLLAIRLGEATTMQSVFSADYLLERPLLAAIRRPSATVLLIDEVDRADEEFEAYLLEVLSDYQVSVPELGILKARSTPLTILTSNATRALSDALRRRCLYYYVDYPSEEKEQAIIEARLPGIDRQLAQQAAKFVRLLRVEDLEKKPGVAETLDWTAALMRLHISNLAQAEKHQKLYTTLSCLLKTSADRQAVPPQKASLLASRVA